MRDWSGDATKLFKGKVVERIGYLNPMECEAMGWQPTPFINCIYVTLVIRHQHNLYKRKFPY